ncbi:MAG: CpaF family protein, partial [Deltaproteobacteria bacterium]
PEPPKPVVKKRVEPKREVKAPAPPPEPEPEPYGDEEAELDAWAEWNATVAVVLEGIEAASNGRELTWEEANRIAEAFVAKAVDAGRIAEDVERDALVADAVTEAVGLGPLADLLADDEVSRIAVDGPDVLRVWRGAGPAEPSGRVFSSHTSYERVLRRLLTDAGVPEGPLGPVVEATLPTGASLTVVSAPIATDGALLMLRRPSRLRPSLADLVAAGGLNETMAKGIEAAVAEGKNIVIAGPPGSGRTTLLNAIVGLAGSDERLVVVGDGHEIVAPQPDLARVARRSTANDHVALYGSVTRLRPDRVVVDDIDADNIIAVMSLALSGGAPLLVAARDGDPDRLLRRLAMQIDLANGGQGDRGRFIVGEAFDLVVCLARTGTGDVMVSQLVAVAGGKDGFSHRVVAKHP